MLILLLVAVACVAFTNGANANFKGVASLYGSGTTSRRVALYWATIATMAGSITACFVAHGLLRNFSGKGMVPDELVTNPSFLISVASGTAITSFLATRLGFPVSTTHAMVGSLIGAGFTGGGTQIKLSALGQNFLLPLLFSPLLALVLGAMAYLVLRTCHLAPDHRTRTLDVCHFISSGAASFSRGLNDTPKVVAMLLMMPHFDISTGFLLVATLIALGGLVDSKHVAETLSKKVTAMNPGEGFAASLVTAILVTTATFQSLPVSTTHVSVGALVGMGATTGKTHWKKVFEIALAWVATLPIGALFGAGTFLGMHALTT
jgi:PiT family inorganic phosphate transporter